ncbi:MoaD/ThiS, partial [Testicularia cyperi]
SAANAHVTVQYFASARTTIDKSTERIELPSTPFPLSGLIQLLSDKYTEHNLASVLATCRWSVDNTLIEQEDVGEWGLSGGEEVAVIPPVSGG